MPFKRGDCGALQEKIHATFVFEASGFRHVDSEHVAGVDCSLLRQDKSSSEPHHHCSGSETGIAKVRS